MTSRLTGSWGSRIRCRVGAATWRSATTRSSTPCRGCAVYFVKSRWTLSALNLNTFGVQVERRRRLFPCFFVVCLVGLLHEGVSVPVGFAVETDDPAVVHDAVYDRGGHVSVSEHVAPPAGLEVRGGDDAAGLVAVRAGLEQEPGPVDVDGQMAELVDDDQPGPADRLRLLGRDGSRPWPSSSA